MFVSASSNTMKSCNTWEIKLVVPARPAFRWQLYQTSRGLCYRDGLQDHFVVLYNSYWPWEIQKAPELQKDGILGSRIPQNSPPRPAWLLQKIMLVHPKILCWPLSGIFLLHPKNLPKNMINWCYFQTKAYNTVSTAMCNAPCVVNFIAFVRRQIAPDRGLCCINILVVWKLVMLVQLA